MACKGNYFGSLVDRSQIFVPKMPHFIVRPHLLADRRYSPYKNAAHFTVQGRRRQIAHTPRLCR